MGAGSQCAADALFDGRPADGEAKAGVHDYPADVHETDALPVLLGLRDGHAVPFTQAVVRVVECMQTDGVLSSHLLLFGSGMHLVEGIHGLVGFRCSVILLFKLGLENSRAALSSLLIHTT